MSGGTAIEFSPLLPWAVLIPLFVLAAAGVLVALIRRARGTAWRTLGLAALAVALLNPSLVQEDRQPIKDVAVLVVDESPSQNIGERRARTERALIDLQERLARFPDLEVRVVRTSGAEGGVGGAIEETRLFEVLDRAMADLPRRRMAGAVFITDGQVHDVPGEGKGLGDLGPIHTLLTGEHDEADRRLAVVKAPSFGLVGKPVTVTVRVEDMPGNQSPDAVVNIRQDGGAPRPFRVPVGRDMPLEFTLDHGGQNVFEMEVALGSAGTDARQQQGGRRHQRRARPAAGAAGFRRAPCGRADVAQPAEGRSGRRSGPFHDPAAAGEAGRHADPRAVADRLPDPRAVRDQAGRVRPDHLRPLPAARRAAPAIPEQHRAAMWRTAARCWKRAAPASPRP